MDEKIKYFGYSFYDDSRNFVIFSICVRKKQTERFESKADNCVWRRKIEEIGYEGVAQSFMAEGDFNTIEINFVNPKKLKEQEYILSILNTKGDVIHKENFLLTAYKIIKCMRSI